MEKIKQLSFRLPMETWRQFKLRLLKDDLSAQEFLLAAVEDYTFPELARGGNRPGEKEEEK